MPVGDYCRTPIVTVAPDLSVREAARQMKAQGVGTLVVTEAERPVGMLTDRDVALEVLCGHLDAESVPVRDIMRSPVVTLREGTPVAEGARMLEMQRVRRLPVVEKDGKLVGMLSVDDLLPLIARELAGISEAIQCQRPPEPPSQIESIDRSE
jgi:CBS domain-containing protein